MTIAAISTPAGIGGIAVIRVSGPDAIAAVDAHFRPVKTSHRLTDRKTHTLTFGQFLAADDTIVDEVVVSLYRAPHSFTGEDVVEISCHGSTYIQQQILEVLCSSPGNYSLPSTGRARERFSSTGRAREEFSLRLAQPGEFTRRAFQNGRLDLTQAEAVADLIASQSAAAHRMAISQMKGSISRKLDGLRDQLLTLTSLLELELDFSEEEVEFADRQQLRELTVAILSETTRLAETFQAGQAIKNGIPVAILGAPNVGKSTLLNALLDEDKAIVSDIQGTTRDLIEDTIQIQGYLFRFIDTAGLRHTDDTVERLGIERSLSAAERAQIIILLTEPGVPFPTLDLRPDQVVIRRTNKTESFSAKSGIGLDSLRTELVSHISHTSATSDVVISNARHYQHLQDASHSLSRVLTSLDSLLPSDLIAEDLRLANQSLGEILSGGSITSQETLNNIFSHFCIGK